MSQFSESNKHNYEDLSAYNDSKGTNWQRAGRKRKASEALFDTQQTMIEPQNKGIKNIETVKSSTRRWRRISCEERLQLEAAVGFGLPVDFAGKVIQMCARNPNRIMKEQEMRNKVDLKQLSALDPVQKSIAERRI